MKNLKRKILSVFAAFLMVSTFMTVTVYADPDTGLSSNVDPQPVDPQPVDPQPVDPQPVDPQPVDPQPVDPQPVDPQPVNPQPVDPQPVDPQPADPYNTDNNQQNPDDVNIQPNYNDSPQINYDADYYNNMYGENIINYDLNDLEFQSAINDTYNPGMTFDEFEKATDYQYATVAPDKVVNMYNSNGSTSAQRLSEKDWKDISLSFDNKGLDGTGDFSFIKDNDSKEDSNFSILFLIFGIVLVLVSVTLVFYMIISSVRRRKRVKAAAAASEIISNLTSVVSSDGTESVDLNSVSEK